MRHFHRRVKLYGVTEQIYKLVGERPFTLDDLLEAGINIHQSNLVNLRNRGAVAAANAGWMPFTPHLNTAHFEDLCPGVSHEEWLAGDLAILSLLDPARDAVLMLPRWILSRGAKIEHEAALSRNLQVYYADAIAGGVPEVPK